MYSPVSPRQSGLLQQQPQRYSDRHRQPTTSSGKYQASRPCAAQAQDGSENSSQPDDAPRTSKQDDDQGIKSYLKKTHATDPDRKAKADANKQAEKD